MVRRGERAGAASVGPPQSGACAVVSPAEPGANPPPTVARERPDAALGESMATRAAAARAAMPKPQLPKLTDDPIGDPPSAASTWNVANALTVLRLVLVPVFVVALFAGGGHERGYRVLAWGVFALAAVTDRIDGDLARRRNLVTEFGKLVDPIADKALIGAALIGLSLLGDLPWWVTVVVLTRELGVTLLRFWVIRHGVIPASRGGKLKALLLNVATGLFVLLPIGSWIEPIAWIFMLAAIVVAVVTGIDYVARAMRLRRTVPAGA